MCVSSSSVRWSERDVAPCTGLSLIACIKYSRWFDLSVYGAFRVDVDEHRTHTTSSGENMRWCVHCVWYMWISAKKMRKFKRNSFVFIVQRSNYNWICLAHVAQAAGFISIINYLFSPGFLSGGIRFVAHIQNVVMWEFIRTHTQYYSIVCCFFQGKEQHVLFLIISSPYFVIHLLLHSKLMNRTESSPCATERISIAKWFCEDKMKQSFPI